LADIPMRVTQTICGAPTTTAYVGWGDGFIVWRNTGSPDLFMVKGFPKKAHRKNQRA
jgi:hypothetical protein